MMTKHKESVPNSSSNYNECVDYLVNSMKQSTDNLDPTFDTNAYANYKALVDKQREQIDKDGLTESLYKLGYKIDTLLSKIISQLDTLIKEDSEEENDNQETESLYKL